MRKTLAELAPVLILLGLLELSLGRSWGWALLALGLAVPAVKFFRLARSLRIRIPRLSLPSPKQLSKSRAKGLRWRTRGDFFTGLMRRHAALVFYVSLCLAYLSACLLAWYGFRRANYALAPSPLFPLALAFLLLAAFLCAYVLFSSKTHSAAAITPARRSWQAALVPLALFLFALLIRHAWVLDVPAGFSQDEVKLAATSLAAQPARAFADAGDYLTHLCLRSVGVGAMGLRIAAVLIGTLGVALTFLLGRLVLPGRGGLYAAALLAVMPFHFAASRVSGASISTSLVLPLALALAVLAREKWRFVPPLVILLVPALLLHTPAACLQASLVLLLLYYALPGEGRRRIAGAPFSTPLRIRAALLTGVILLALSYGGDLVETVRLLTYHGLGDAKLGFAGMGPIGPALLPLFLIAAAASLVRGGRALFPGSVYLLSFLIAFQPRGSGTHFALALTAPLVALGAAAALLRLERVLRKIAPVRWAHRALLVALSAAVLGWGYFGYYAEDVASRDILDFKLHRLTYYLDAAGERQMSPYLSPSLRRRKEYVPFLQGRDAIRGFDASFRIPDGAVLLLDGAEKELYDAFDSQKKGIYRREITNGRRVVMRVIYRPKVEGSRK